jgi:hypothetical protein
MTSITTLTDNQLKTTFVFLRIRVLFLLHFISLLLILIFISVSIERQFIYNRSEGLRNRSVFDENNEHSDVMTTSVEEEDLAHYQNELLNTSDMDQIERGFIGFK